MQEIERYNKIASLLEMLFREVYELKADGDKLREKVSELERLYGALSRQRASIDDEWERAWQREVELQLSMEELDKIVESYAR
jgi:FtsZ-binding cell division protein ZapB